MKFQSLKLRTQIFSIFMILGLLMIVMISTILIQLGAIGDKLREIAEKNIPLAEVMTQITEHQLGQAIWFERALRAGIQQQAGEKSKKLISLAEEKFKKLAVLVDEEIKNGEKIVEESVGQTRSEQSLKDFLAIKELLKVIGKEHSDYNRHILQIFTYLNKNLLGDEFNVLIEKVEEEEEQLTHEIKNFLFQIEKFTKTSLLQAEQDEENIVVIAWGALLFSLVFGIGLSLVITKRVLKQIGGEPTLIIEMSQQLAEGQFDNRFEIDEKNLTGIQASIVQTARQLKERNEEIKESEARSQGIVNTALDGIALITSKGIVEAFNPAAESLFGYSFEEVIGQNVKMLMPASFATEHDGYLENYMRSGVKKIIGIGREVVGKRKDGSEFSIYLSVGEIIIDEQRFFTGIVRDITENKKAETQLKESEARSQGIVNTALDGIALITSKGIVEAFNPAAESLFGYSSEEVIGQNVKVLMPASFATEHDGYLENYMRSGVKKIIGIGREVVGKRKDGSEFPIYLSVGEIIIDEQQFFTGIVRDITESKAAEAQLKEREAQSQRQNWLKSGQNNLNEIMRGDLDNVTLARKITTFLAKYLNAQIGALYLAEDSTDFLKLFGSYAFTMRKDLNERIKIGEGIVGQAAFENEMISLTNVPETYTRIHSAIGDEIPRNVVVTPFTYEDRMSGVIELGSFQEFSDLQMEFLTSVIESISIGFNSAQARRKNQDLLEETQRQAEELQSQQEELMTSNEELEEQTQSLKQSEEKLQSQQEDLRSSNEELEGQTQALALQQAEVKIKNQELEQAKLEVEEKAQALELSSKYKSEFLANMSHELRSPLNSLLLFAENLEANKEGNLTEKQTSGAKYIHESGVELLNLINEVLDLSKVEAGKMEVVSELVSPKELITYVETNFEHLIEKKGLKLQIEVDKTLPDSLLTDVQKVCQILKNFISNAIKFTNEGSITFAITSPTKQHRKKFHLDPAHKIALSVSDTGEGIPQDKQQLIFEAFQQADGSTSRIHGGTGLGLSISRELAKLLQGMIGLESTKNKGSAFTLYLPEILDFTNPEPAQEFELRPKSQIMDQKPQIIEIPDDRVTLSPSDRTLLIVEDDPKFIQLLSDQAHNRDFKVLIAQDGEAGVHMAQEYGPSAIILDIGLPKMDGWMVMNELKTNATSRHIPVHFISALDESQRARKMGAIGYLSKPVSQSDLENTFQHIEQFLEKTLKHLLIVEDEEIVQEKMIELIGNGDVEVCTATSAEEAIDLFQSQSFDCIVLDLHLKGMSGFEFLEKVNRNSQLDLPPVVIYTGKELTEEEDRKLKRYTQSIVIKGAKSLERLLAEVTLFLHRIETDLPKKKQKILQQVYDPETALQGKTVLLVDDDTRNIFALIPILRDAGLKTFEAYDGKEALKELKKHSKEVDLILMDLMMPEMDGYEAIRKIRKQPQFQDIPIIALTAKAMPEDREKCLAVGASDYLSKPIDTTKLLSLLRVWINN